MVIAVTGVDVMHVPLNKIVLVVPVRHRGMSAGLRMHVAAFMCGARVTVRAVVRMSSIDGNAVFVDVVAVYVVEMTVVQVVDVVAVAYCRMLAVTVDMFVFGVSRVGRHFYPLPVPSCAAPK